MTNFRALLKTIVPQSLINTLYHLPKAAIAGSVYGYPARDLFVIGVTGTDGKTTTTNLIYHILKTAKKKVAVISTVDAKIGRKSIKTGLHVTSPDPFQLQSLLRKMRSQKVRYVCLEATSHGLDQYRLFGIDPKISVLTNVTHEHLDYHSSMESYMKAKLRLFKRAEHAVVNKDLPVFQEVNEALGNVMLSTYSIHSDSQLKPTSVRLLKTKTNFTLGDSDYEFPLPGEYNLYNALAAISTCLILDIDPKIIRRALKTFKGVTGRLEEIKNDKRKTIIIDFAHTPNALDSALTHLRNTRNGKSKLIAVFGSAGLRDHAKRPLMGAAAARNADIIILTAEDPRTENVDDIITDIRTGIPTDFSGKVIAIPDRQEAITAAINKYSQPGDIIGIFGKGHEESMCFGTDETPWSEHEAVAKALQS